MAANDPDRQTSSPTGQAKSTQSQASLMAVNDPDWRTGATNFNPAKARLCRVALDSWLVGRLYSCGYMPDVTYVAKVRQAEWHHTRDTPPCAPTRSRLSKAPATKPERVPD